MRMGFRGFFSSVLVLAGLSGCGGANFGDTVDFGGGGGGGTSTAAPSNVNLVISSASLASDAFLPGTGVAIGAIVTDANNVVIEGVTVAFSATSGALAVANTGLTDATGLAVAELTTGGNPLPRIITVTATAGSISRTANVTVVTGSIGGPSISTLTLLPSTGTIPSDADTQAEGLVITAIAKNTNNIGVEDVDVTFSATSGQLVGISATTDADGFATATLTTGGDPTIRSITVTANAGGVTTSNTYNVVNPQSGFGVSSLRLSASRSSLAPTATNVVDGVTITAFATDANGNAAPNAPITFDASSGQLVNVSSTTDALGRATAVLTTGGDPTLRTITISATIGSLTANLTPPIQVSDTDTTRTITLVTDRTRIGPDATSGSQGAQLTATFIGPPGTSVAGVEICFQATSNGAFEFGSVTPQRAFTNSVGQARAVVTTGGDSTPRDILVTAVSGVACRGGTIGDPEDASSQPVTITVRSLATAASLAVTSDTNILSPEADSLDEAATITAIVLGPGGVALVGVPVSFSTTTGALLQAQTRTDENGVATVKLTTGGNSTPRNATVTATADGQSGSVVISIRRASSLDITIVPSTLPSDADTLAEAAVVTATLLDEDGDPIAGVPVTFGATGGNIQVTRGVTDSSGTAEARLTTGGNSTPRTITVTATSTVAGTTLTRTVTVPVLAPVAEITLISSSPQLPSGASTVANGITLTAIVKNDEGVLVEGVPVSFSAPGGALQVTQGTTDASGTATAILTTGGNPANRTINVTATASGETSNVVPVDVIGTTLQINGPIVVGAADSALYTLSLRDSALSGISGRAIAVSSSLANQIRQVGGDGTCTTPGTVTASVTTDFNGAARFCYIGTNGGSDIITAQSVALNVSTQLNVTVVGNKLVFVPQCSDGDDNDSDGDTDSGVGNDANCASATDDNESAFPGDDPAVFIDGSAVPVTVNYKENNVNIANEPITFVITRGDLDNALGAPYDKIVTVNTDVSGNATITILSDGSDGTGGATLTAQASSGAETSQQVVIVSTDPTTVAVQASPATIPVSGTSTVTAVVRDANDNLVANQTVSFSLVDPTGGTLSAASGVTNSQGAISVTYQATSTPSATNGVVVRATVDPPGPDPEFFSQTTITVAGQALFIAIGTGNQIEEPTSTTYRLPFTAVVTDAAGNPAPPNTVFRLSVISVAYQRGAFVNCAPPWIPSYTIPGPGLTSNFGAGCLSEDVNANGILNAGEDANSSGRLEPGNVVTIPSTVALVDGVAQFGLTYPQDRAAWVKVTLRATASVAGSESVEETTFVLEGLASDYTNCNAAPPGQISPYGTGASCSSTANSQCSDGVDNDGDGQTDANDLSCDNVLDDDEFAPTQCSDLVDNDGDGKVDSADPDCTDSGDNFEQATTICSDTIDNDGDGQIDFPFDGGCQSFFDTTEAPNAECSDSLDNDADGLTDYPADPSCVARQDKTEQPVNCEDGVDNDADTFIDFPDDPDCESLEDIDEAN